jgi:hypothetical protein
MNLEKVLTFLLLVFVVAIVAITVTAKMDIEEYRKSLKNDIYLEDPAK